MADEAQADAAKLREHLAGLVPRWQLPERWAFVTEVPPRPRSASSTRSGSGAEYADAAYDVADARTEMRALKLVDANRLELRDVPFLSPGRVRVRIAGAGIRHSDVTIMAVGAAGSSFSRDQHRPRGRRLRRRPRCRRDGLTEASRRSSTMWACGHCRQCVGGPVQRTQTNGHLVGCS